MSEADGIIYGVCLQVQEKEIEKYCFDICGKICIGGFTVPVDEEHELALLPCWEKNCLHCEKEQSLGESDLPIGKVKIVLRKLKRYEQMAFGDVDMIK